MTRHVNRWTALFGWVVMMFVVWTLLVPRAMSVGTFTLLCLAGPVLLVAATSLQEILLEQVRESILPQEDWPTAEMLIGNVDEYGYLKATIEELVASTGLPADKILSVLKVIQTFEPVGVGAAGDRHRRELQARDPPFRPPEEVADLRAKSPTAASALLESVLSGCAKQGTGA